MDIFDRTNKNPHNPPCRVRRTVNLSRVEFRIVYAMEVLIFDGHKETLWLR
jgi:hypothetical protein